MYFPHLLVQLSVLIIFGISAYKAVNAIISKKLLESLFNASVAIVAFSFLF
jgi:hypothetical protein